MMNHLVYVLMSALVFALFVPKMGLLKLNLGGDKYSLLVHAVLFALTHRTVSHLIKTAVKPLLKVAKVEDNKEAMY